MLRFQSGPRLAAGSSRKPLRPFTVAAFVMLSTTLVSLVAPLAANAQAQAHAHAHAHAQTPQARQATNLRADPLNAQASIPPLLHESAFTQYRRLTDVPVGSWRDANDTVNRIGGWRAYAREAAQPASPPTAVPAGRETAPGMKPVEPGKAAPVPGGKEPHAGHKMN